MNSRMLELLDTFYDGEIPGYIVTAGKTYITLLLAQWEGDCAKPVKIRIADVIEYYRSQANNIVSGCRTIAGFTGDWRHVDNIAKECLGWFKYVNVEELRRAGCKVGLEPRF